MVHVQTRYALIDKKTAKINRLWKDSHILLLLCAAISGFITTFTIAAVNRAFGNNCILFASLAFVSPKIAHKSLSETFNDSAPQIDTTTPVTWQENYPLDTERTQWGSYWLCSFCQFTPLMSMIFALLWLTFFIMCGTGGGGFDTDVLAKPWRIVYPALTFSFIFAIVLTVSTVYTSQGLTEFCKGFKQHVEFEVYRCIPEINKFTKYFMNDETKEAYIPAILCLVFGHVGLYAWWIQTALLILRIICVVDFDIVVHRISSAARAPDTTGSNIVEEAEV